jgi:hypothetical protein
VLAQNEKGTGHAQCGGNSYLSPSSKDTPSCNAGHPSFCRNVYQFESMVCRHLWTPWDTLHATIASNTVCCGCTKVNQNGVLCDFQG